MDNIREQIESPQHALIFLEGLATRFEDEDCNHLPDLCRSTADLMEKLDTVANAARAFADSMICLDTECVHKKCVLNRAFAVLDSGE